MPSQALPARSKLSKGGTRGKKVKVWSAVLVFLVLAAAWVGIQKAKDIINGRMIPTAEAEEGVIQRGVPVTVLILRDELVLTAQIGGTVKEIAGEGARVRVGSPVARIIPVDGVAEGTARAPGSTFELLTPKAGTVCYHPDGLEGVFSPQALGELNWDVLEQVENAEIPPTGGGTVLPGRPVAKIINNLSPSLLFTKVARDGPASTVKAGQSLLVEWEDGGLGNAEVITVRTQGAEVGLVLRLSPGDNLPHDRRVAARLVLERHTGVVVPVQALVEQNGKTGVMVLGKLGVSWQQVGVKARLDGKAVVDGLHPGARVLLNPTN